MNFDADIVQLQFACPSTRPPVPLPAISWLIRDFPIFLAGTSAVFYLYYRSKQEPNFLRKYDQQCIAN
jgi:hypothetical protein